MKYLIVLFAELRMNIKSQITYRLGILSEIIIISLLYIGLLFFDSGRSIGMYYGNVDESKALLLVGYIMWSVSCTAINVVSQNISIEARQGTLQVKYMSIVPLPIIMIGNLISSTILEFLEVTIIILISILFFDIPLVITLESVLALILTMIGMYGIGLGFGGVAFLEKQIGKFIYIFQIVILIFTDVISVNNSVYIFRKFLPLSYGIDFARSSISNISIGIDEWLVFTGVSISYFLLGAVVFKIFEKKSLLQGNMGQY